jgi:hypothetical protein
MGEVPAGPDRLMLADELLSSIEESDGSDTKCTVQDRI